MRRQLLIRFLFSSMLHVIFFSYFKIFSSLSVASHSLIIMSQHRHICLHSVWCLTFHSNKICFIKLGKILVYVKILFFFFCPNLFSLSGFPISYMLNCLILSHSSLRFCHFFFSFFSTFFSLDNFYWSMFKFTYSPLSCSFSHKSNQVTRLF